MRHRRKGRVLGRSPSHQRALLRNLAAALFLTEREVEADDAGRPKMSGRIVTTVAKAKEVRPLVERCITIAKKGLVALEEARVHEAPSERDSPAWKRWRSSEAWQAWAKAMAPVVVARRRVVTLLGDKQAAKILFERVAPRYRERPGGYTRILKLARPRLGDAGPRAILELVQDPLASAASAPKVSSRRR